MKRILIVGCGFVGMELAKQWQITQHGCVFALTRHADRADQLRASGIEPIVGHWHDPSTLLSLPKVDAMIVSVPHREDSGLGVDSHAIGLKNLMEHLPEGFRKLIYLSTTGVYGDAHDVVDEFTPTQPTRIGPQIAVAAEQWLMTHYEAPRLAIIRLAGIYGPGRIPLADKLRAGEVLHVPQVGWLNLIHVSDIAAMLLQVVQRDLPQALYVLSDGQPVARLDFYHTLAKYCGVNEPKFAEPDPSASRSQRAGKKQVNPQRLINDLQLKLQFPSYKEGLANCLAGR